MVNVEPCRIAKPPLAGSFYATDASLTHHMISVLYISTPIASKMMMVIMLSPTGWRDFHTIAKFHPKVAK